MNKAKGRRRKTSDQIITARLTPGKDDDLIDWWNSLVSGEGTQELKAALRAHISQGDPSAHMNQSLERLANEVKALNQKISQGVTIGNGASAPDSLGDDQAEARRRKLAEARW